jgi:hypothetical protein
LTPDETIERERRWATAAALGTFAAVVLAIAAAVLLARKFGGDNAEALRKINDDSGTLVLLYVMRAVAAALLAIPLVYLFQAALARSDKMRGQLIGLTVAGPLFLAAFSIFTGLSLHDAAPDFVARSAAHHLGTGDHADKVAQHVIDDSSLRGLVAGFFIGGTLGFAFAMAYTCLHAMRVGLLPRFWGALGVALGVVSVFPQFFQFTLLWMLYLGVLFAGRMPGGRPPAWAAGEAIPWPTPGEKMAEQMSGEDEGGGEEDAAANPPRQTGERRKRKRRSGA